MAQQLQTNELLNDIIGVQKAELTKRLIDTDDPVETIAVRQTIRAYEYLENIIRQEAEMDVKNAA